MLGVYGDGGEYAPASVKSFCVRYAYDRSGKVDL